MATWFMPAPFQFQSTLSVRRATYAPTGYGRLKGFQSTLSVRRATDLVRKKWGDVRISIHALREESDHLPIIQLRAGQFQSTLSVRRATFPDECPM